MSREEIFEQVKDVIVEQLGVDRGKIEESSTFIEDLAADSLDVVELIMNLEDETKEITQEDKGYINDIVQGVMAKKEELDEKIRKYLKGWTMDRISKTDLAILRLAIYEITYRDDIPYKVSVNEAVELAKTFSDSTSSSFINGVLAGVVTEL